MNNKLIFIVTKGVYSDYHIIAATTAREDAEKIASYYDADVESWETADVKALNNREYRYYFDKDGKFKRIFEHGISEYDFHASSYVSRNYCDDYVIHVYTDKPKDVADKIAYDMLAQARAEELRL